MIEISKVILNISTFVIFLPFGLAILGRKKMQGPLYVIICYLLTGTIAQLIGYYTKSNRINNLPLLHLYTVIEFGWITWFYHLAMPAYLNRRNAFLAIAFFTVAALLNSLFLQPINQFNTYTRTVESLTTIAFSLIYFYKTISEMRIVQLEREPIFWINVGFLIYFSGGTLLFVFSNFILPFNHNLNIYVWTIHAIFSILLYLLLSIGIWLAVHKQT